MAEPKPLKAVDRGSTLAALSVIVLLVVLWAGPSIWWVLAECQSICRPSETSGALDLRGGNRVSILSRTMEQGTVHVDYVTHQFGNRRLLCAEMRDIIEALRAEGDLAHASRIMLSPTDPRRRFQGLTWQGPVFSCCVSIGVIIKKSEGDRWILSSAGCGE